MAEWKPGKNFEEAVYRIVKALGPSAKVKHDFKTPDRHTGTLRQCDVWVEARFQGHFPIKCLISCKDWSRKLDIEDVSAFKAQIESVGASSGAIYSRQGFTEPAIKKAEALGIACCRLYENQPADVPQVLVLRSYLCSTRVQLHINKMKALHPEIRSWSDLFSLPVNDPETGATVSMLDMFAKLYRISVRSLSGERSTKTKGY